MSRRSCVHTSGDEREKISRNHSNHDSSSSGDEREKISRSQSHHDSSSSGDEREKISRGHRHHDSSSSGDEREKIPRSRSHHNSSSNRKRRTGDEREKISRSHSHHDSSSSGDEREKISRSHSQHDSSSSGDEREKIPRSHSHHDSSSNRKRRTGDEREKTSRSYSHHDSSSNRKRRTGSSSFRDEVQVKRRKRDVCTSFRSSEISHYHAEHKHGNSSTHIKDKHGNNTNRASNRNQSRSTNVFRRPRSRSRSREKRRTPEKYSSSSARSKVSRRTRTPDQDRDKYNYRQNSNRVGRNSELDSSARLPAQIVERNNLAESEYHQTPNWEGERVILSNNAISTANVEKQMKPGVPVPGATKLVEEIEKRKLLFSKKEKPTEASSSVWERTKFSQDSGGKMTAKFKRLMGIKDEGESNTSHEQPLPSGTKQEKYFEDLEKQYEIARATTHTQRGAGFGFSASSRIFLVKPKP